MTCPKSQVWEGAESHLKLGLREDWLFLIQMSALEVSRPLSKYLDILVVQRHQVGLAFRVVLWALEHRESPAPRVLQDVLKKEESNI